MNYAPWLSDDTLAIFLLHGVISAPIKGIRNYTHKHILQDDFALFLQSLLRAGGTPLTMDEVVSFSMAQKPWPKKSFAITFDDGFQNNLTVAAPVLSDYKTPAIFYVSTAFIDENSMSWIDRIEWLIDQIPQGKLRLPWEGADRSFSNAVEKIEILKALRSHVKSDPHIILDELVENIFSQFGEKPVVNSPHVLDQKLTWHEVKRLHQGIFRVGGHSHHHLNMAFLSKQELDKEIATSLRLLKEKAQIETVHYAYPEGLSHCYSEPVIESLKRHGIVSCPTAIEGLNLLSEDLFHLKRIMVVP